MATTSFDASGVVVTRVREAKQRDRGLAIRGGRTRAAWHKPVRSTGIEVDLTQHAGILTYEPSELVLSARAGTRLIDIEQSLAEQGQLLPFDPPRFGSASTLGGVVASGLSGPGRPWLGAVRDALLGIRLVDGHGAICRFGGEVMKNVAGYDLARLQAGAFGTLGIMLDISLRVRAAPEVERTQELELSLDTALARMLTFGRRPWPLTGLAWANGQLYVRLAGTASGVAKAAVEVGGTQLPDNRFWLRLRDLELGALTDFERPLWRLSMPYDAPLPPFPASWVLDWGGAQRWCLTDAAPEQVLTTTQALGGHATRLRPDLLRTPPAPAVAMLEARVRAALDPARVLNPGVMETGGT